MRSLFSWDLLRGAMCHWAYFGQRWDLCIYTKGRLVLSHNGIEVLIPLEYLFWDWLALVDPGYSLGNHLFELIWPCILRSCLCQSNVNSTRRSSVWWISCGWSLESVQSKLVRNCRLDPGSSCGLRFSKSWRLSVSVKIPLWIGVRYWLSPGSSGIGNQ